MKRITLTITRYEKPENPEADMPMSRVSDRGYMGYREDNTLRMPEVPRENVLVVDLDEAQYEAIKKAALETF